MSSLHPICTDATVPVDEFSSFAETVFAHLQRADQRRWGRAYLLGLLTAPGKKSVRRLAAAVTDSPTASQSLQQFVNSSPWEWEPVRHELASWAEERLQPRVWTIATTIMPKRGEHSCGVHKRFIPQLGQNVNCQIGVGLFLSNGTAAVPVDWRLHLPKQWSLPHLRRRARIPGEARPLPMWAEVFDMVDRLHRLTGVTPVPFVADMRDTKQTGDLAHLLPHQRHDFMVAVPGTLPVLPLEASGRDLMTTAPPGTQHSNSLTGCLPAHSVVSGYAPGAHRDASMLSCLVRLPPTTATSSTEKRGIYRLFADLRRPTVVWITNMVRRRASELSSLIESQTATTDTVRELEQDFGLLDFEGRSYPGWHHHMTLVSAAQAYQVLAGTPHSPARTLEPVPA